jgi:putative exporter of polyketide antibiotics
MMVLMFYVASAVSAMRQDEAMGYLDNFLVRRVGRLGWLLGRAGLIVMGIIVACTVTWLGVWLGEHGQAGAVSGHDLFLASANMVAPAIFVLGFGIACLGLIPRLSGLLSYCVIGWSFMLQILSSGIHINHWVMDTAVLTHVALAPSVSPRWGTDAILILVGVALAVVGTIVFTHRDITSE